MMARKPILSGIVFGVLILISALALKYAAARHLVSGDVPMRAIQILIGLMMAFNGSAIPKKLPRFREGESGVVQSLQRTVGWLLTVAGLGYAAAWALAPLSEAAGWSMAVVGAAIALVAVNVVRTHLAQRRAGSAPG
jgi:hypothetical protein